MPLPTRFLLLWCLIWLPWFASGAQLPNGKGHLSLKLNGTVFDVFTYRPQSFSNGPLLVVMHGVSRNADSYRDYAMPIADQSGMLVVAPRFDASRFPTDAYQRGNLIQNGTAQPKERWTYSYITSLIAEVRAREGRPDMPVYLIGHSAGGQFNTRLAAFAPGDAVRIVAANPGSHLFPTRDLPFPYGFGGLPNGLGDDAVIKRYLAAPLSLLLGTADTGEKNLDESATAMKQGATRIERGRKCFQFAAELARKNGWPFNWRVVEIEGVGHESSKMFASPKASLALFGDKCLTEPPGKAELLKRASPAR